MEGPEKEWWSGTELGDNERVGREEEGTSSGREEIGAYVVILRHTPDHENLITSTDSEVLGRLVVTGPSPITMTT